MSELKTSWQKFSYRFQSAWDRTLAQPNLSEAGIGCFGGWCVSRHQGYSRRGNTTIGRNFQEIQAPEEGAEVWPGLFSQGL